VTRLPSEGGAEMWGRYGGRHRVVLWYNASGTQPWSFAINADSGEHRRQLRRDFGGFRGPHHFRGVPL